MIFLHHLRIQSGSDDPNTKFMASFMPQTPGISSGVGCNGELNWVDLDPVLIETRLLERNCNSPANTAQQRDR